MQSNGLNPSQKSFWIRVGVLILAFAGVIWVMLYFQSGSVVQNPEVQAIMNPAATQPADSSVNDR